MGKVKTFNCISKPSDIRLVEGVFDGAENWRILLCSGGIIIAPPSVAISDLADHLKEVKYTLCLPSGVMIEAGLDGDMLFVSALRQNQYRALDAKQLSRVSKYFEVLRLAMDNLGVVSSDDEIRFASMAFAILCRQWYDQREALEDNSRQAQIANEFILLVSQNCHKERGMSFYADKLAIAPKYLSFVVSSRTGRTAADWIKEYTMAKAKDLLLNSSLSINEVSDQLNFITSSDFCKWFRRCSGLSPKEFRGQLVSQF